MSESRNIKGLSTVFAVLVVVVAVVAVALAVFLTQRANPVARTTQKTPSTVSTSVVISDIEEDLNATTIGSPDGDFAEIEKDVSSF